MYAYVTEGNGCNCEKYMQFCGKYAYATCALIEYDDKMYPSLFEVEV